MKVTMKSVVAMDMFIGMIVAVTERIELIYALVGVIQVIWVLVAFCIVAVEEGEECAPLIALQLHLVEQYVFALTNLAE